MLLNHRRQILTCLRIAIRSCSSQCNAKVFLKTQRHSSTVRPSASRPRSLPHTAPQCKTAGFDLHAFVLRNFTPQNHAAKHYRSAPGQPIAEHIDGLWDELTRHPAQHPHGGSRLQLPHPYVVPGGRFVEMYYWDSYFTMLGLVGGARATLLHAMTDNFAYLIDTFGHVPNGTRTYYLSRSQPPAFLA